MRKKKVRLLEDLPVDKKHGLVKDLIVEIELKSINGNDGWWYEGKHDPVKIYPHEFADVRKEVLNERRDNANSRRGRTV